MTALKVCLAGLLGVILLVGCVLPAQVGDRAGDEGQTPAGIPTESPPRPALTPSPPMSPTGTPLYPTPAPGDGSPTYPAGESTSEPRTSGTPYIPATGLPPTAVPPLGAGQPFTLALVDMANLEQGWALDVDGRILHTSDGGESWEQASPPEGGYTVQGFYALDGSAAWAVPGLDGSEVDTTYIEIWRTTDAGSTWVQSQPFPTYMDRAGGDVMVGYIHPISLQFSDGQNGWLLYEYSYQMSQAHVALLHTRDGGATWLMVNDRDHDLFVCAAVDLAFVDAASGWVGANCLSAKFGQTTVAQIASGEALTLKRSNDAGFSFTETTLLPSPAGLLPELTSPNLATTAADCGVTRMEVPVWDDVFFEMACQVYGEGNIVYRFVYVSPDGGQTWQVSLGNGSEYFVNASTGWRLNPYGLGETRSLERTDDGGQTWTPMTTVTWQSAQFDFVDDQNGWALVQNGAERTLLRTVDGGWNWKRYNPTVTRVSGL